MWPGGDYDTYPLPIYPGSPLTCQSVNTVHFITFVMMSPQLLRILSRFKTSHDSCILCTSEPGISDLECLQTGDVLGTFSFYH